MIKQRRKTFQKLKRQRFLELAAMGIEYNNICLALGISRSTAFEWRREYGIAPRKRGPKSRAVSQ